VHWLHPWVEKQLIKKIAERYRRWRSRRRFKPPEYTVVQGDFIGQEAGSGPMGYRNVVVGEESNMTETSVLGEYGLIAHPAKTTMESGEKEPKEEA